MKLLILIGIISLVCLLALALVVALYKNKKAAAGKKQPPGQLGHVHTTLSPEGTVLIDGELWGARAVDERAITPSTLVRIVGSEDHLLLVEELNEPSGINDSRSDG